MVRKAADYSTVTKRLLDSRDAVFGEPDKQDLSYLHVVLAQCGLPYREPPEGTRDYHRTNGLASLVVTAGYLRDPHTRQHVLQGLPYGTKPRLLLLHLCSYAKRYHTPVVPVGDSMSAFMRDVGLKVTGGKNGTVGQFKEQLNRLAAARMQIFMTFHHRDAIQETTLNTEPIKRYDVWFPSDPNQKMLWPSTVTLSSDFYESLQEHALPVDMRAIRGVQNSARALDVYLWLVYRLPRVRDQSGEFVPWLALQDQFGPDIENWRDFKKDFLTALRKAVAIYPDARLEQERGGLRLYQSKRAVPQD